MMPVSLLLNRRYCIFDESMELDLMVGKSKFCLIISRSKTLLIYFIVIHSLVLITLLSLLDKNIWKLLIILAVTLSFIHYCRRYQWLPYAKSIIRVERNIDKQWSCHQRDNYSNDNLKLVNSFVIPELVILNLQHSNRWKKKSILIMEDTVDADLFRQLRIDCRLLNSSQIDTISQEKNE